MDLSAEDEKNSIRYETQEKLLKLLEGVLEKK